ncbi:MAG: hypothetical protein V2J42_14775 [Wenzhouxiangella sp.]|nr:hypothetical protein [Wenzhouxiangella sp.]
MVDLQLDQVLPNESQALAAQPVELRALLVEYAADPLLLIQAQAALTRHPAMAPAVMLAFGDEPDFRAVLGEYGAAMIPPVHFFMHNEVRTIEVMKQMGGLTSRLGALIGLGDGASSIRTLPPELERGWFAIAFVRAEGYGFIGQFVVDEEGQVHWLQSERLLEGINAFFASGLRNLERRYRQGEVIRIQDAGSAAIDVAIGVSVFKLVKAIRSGRLASQQAGLAKRSVALAPVMVRQSAVASRLLRIGVPLAAGYLMIRHPSLINSSLAWLAERMDLPVVLVQFVGWTLLLLPILYAAGLLLWPLARLLDVGARLARPASRVGKPE